MINELGEVELSRNLFLNIRRYGAKIFIQFLIETTVSCVRYSNRGIITVLCIYKRCLSVILLRRMVYEQDWTSLIAWSKT